MAVKSGRKEPWRRCVRALTRCISNCSLDALVSGKGTWQDFLVRVTGRHELFSSRILSNNPRNYPHGMSTSRVYPVHPFLQHIILYIYICGWRGFIRVAGWLDNKKEGGGIAWVIKIPARMLAVLSSIHKNILSASSASFRSSTSSLLQAFRDVSIRCIIYDRKFSTWFLRDFLFLFFSFFF